MKTILDFFSRTNKTKAQVNSNESKTGKPSEQKEIVESKFNFVIGISPKHFVFLFLAKLFVPGTIVWAKLDGYPWWPGIVCKHPAMQTHFKTTKGRDFVHVQYFESPPSRSWVHLK